MKFSFVCTYCGNRWLAEYYHKSYSKHEKCPKCNDSQLKVEEYESSKIDQYKDCPEFPKEEEKERDNYDDYL